MQLTIISLIILLLALSGKEVSAQQNLDRKVAGLKKQLHLLSQYPSPYFIQDIDSLVTETGKNLVSILKSKDYLKDKLYTLPNLNVITSPDKRVNVYSFAYYSGGTRMDVGHAIIQWKKNDGTWGAYELFKPPKNSFTGLETGFHKIEKLTRNKENLYLLFGEHRGSSQFTVSYAFVVQIKNNQLILNYPAFPDNSSTLILYNHSGASFQYDRKKEKIIINGFDSEFDRIGKPKDMYNIAPYNIKGKKQLSFTFNGSRFIMK